MATIKDIARAAGVAQGTVSNVLNGKGNVSSEKIRQVMDAAADLGYVPNERAKLLRKGHSNILAVLLPNIQFKQYTDFYLSFKTYAENHGYSVALYLTNNDNSEAEATAVQDIKAAMAVGIAAISGCAFPPTASPYHDELGKLMEHLLFAERRPAFQSEYLGFDYEKAGSDLAGAAMEKNYSSLFVLTGSLHFSNERDFYNGFMKVIGRSGCSITHVETDAYRKPQNIIQMFSAASPQAVFISNYGFAESVKDICHTFFPQADLSIYTVSPVFTMPENDFQKYELNYRQLGKVAAERLIGSITADILPSSLTLNNSGFRDWYANIIPSSTKAPLNVLALDNPSAYILRTLSKLYTQKTGADVNITIYSYDEMYEAFNSLNQDSVFDVLRLDVTWLSWFAQKILQPLDDIDHNVGSCFNDFLDGTIGHYSMVNGRVYALPSTPSVQVLYYRKDLFQSPIYRRMYHEMYRKELLPPTTFEEFNQIARFFTKAYNPSSPVDYGATLTLGSTGVAGSEFLARFFSRQDDLYGSDGSVTLNSANAIYSLEQLIEIRDYSSPNCCAWWTNTATAFSEGNVAMAIMYSNYASDLLSHSSKVVGNIGYMMVPGNNPVIGGGSLGVSKYSKRPKEALSFIRWVCSEPISSASTLLGSVSPCKKTFENYEIVNSYPWLNAVKNYLPLAKGQRVPDFSNKPFDERRFLSIIGMAVKNAYSHAQTPVEALNLAQKMFEEQFP